MGGPPWSGPQAQKRLSYPELKVKQCPPDWHPPPLRFRYPEMESDNWNWLSKLSASVVSTPTDGWQLLHSFSVWILGGFVHLNVLLE